MAIVKYGSFVTSLRGKLGGHVYQKCGKIEGVRNKGTYNNPYSQRLENQRKVIAYLANWWNRIDEQSRNNINAVAHTFPAFDKHGNPVVPSGWNVFVMVNSLLWRTPAGLLLPMQEFIPPMPYQLQQSSLDVPSQSCYLDITGEVTEQTYLLLYAAPPQKANTALKNAKYKYVCCIPRNDITTTNIYTSLKHAFPSIPSPQQSRHLHGWYVPIWTRCIIPFTGSWRDSNYSTLYIYNP